jgi:hypothetical protein
VSNHDLEHYVEWRRTRIAKLEQIFGKEFFKGKTVLECGAGNGLIGKFLREEWGANVSFTEGRPELVATICRNNPGAIVHQVNHEMPWHIGRFDFVIHWGLLYHLNKWRNDITYTVNNVAPGGIMALESEVLDFDDIRELKEGEGVDLDDQALHGVATQMTPRAVEEEFRKLNLQFKRFDDADLNASFHHYDWVANNTGKCRSGQRRFWICYT